jgi:hypothetical protein
MDKERNLIWEAYDQVNEEFRDEDHYAKEPARAAAREWWKNTFLESLPKWPDGSGRSRDVDPPISDISAAVKQFILDSSGKEWFSPTIIANEIHSQIQETNWKEQDSMKIARAVFQPLVQFVNSFPEGSDHVGPQPHPEHKAIKAGEAAQRRYPKDNPSSPFDQQQHPDFEPPDKRPEDYR